MLPDTCALLRREVCFACQFFQTSNFKFTQILNCVKICHTRVANTAIHQTTTTTTTTRAKAQVRFAFILMATMIDESPSATIASNNSTPTFATTTTMLLNSSNNNTLISAIAVAAACNVAIFATVAPTRICAPVRAKFRCDRLVTNRVRTTIGATFRARRRLVLRL